MHRRNGGCRWLLMNHRNGGCRWLLMNRRNGGCRWLLMNHRNGGEQGIEDVYIEILKDIYTDSSVTVHLHKESEKIRNKRGVRQGDTISPKLFTATLESIFRRLNSEHKGVKIDGEFLSNLRFADDIFLCTETPQELLATRTIR